MHAVTVFVLPVFRVSGFELSKRKLFFAWLTQIGRQLAVLPGNQSAFACYCSWLASERNLRFLRFVDFLRIFRYFRLESRTPDVTGKRLVIPPPATPGRSPMFGWRCSVTCNASSKRLEAWAFIQPPHSPGPNSLSVSVAINQPHWVFAFCPR